MTLTTQVEYHSAWWRILVESGWYTVRVEGTTAYMARKPK